METRNNLLRAKRELLQKILDRTVTALADSDKYVEIITALLKKAAKEFKNGTVIPAKGKESQTQKALDAAQTGFTLSSKSTNIAGGFILESEQIEINFSFEAILSKELWGDLELQINQLLFAR